MTAEDTMRSAVEAMKRGAADYLGKPFDLGPRRADREGPRRSRPEPSTRRPSRRRARRATGDRDRRAAGASARGRHPRHAHRPLRRPMVEVFKEIGRVARTEMTVLLMGESGTGKELVARAVHSNSARARGPFVTVNMAAIPRDLIESELYGHEKGSFTGAVERRPGKFELASGGTLFLDEIGEMPIELQAKLLRVLQEREVDRVGGSRPLPVDVRIVAATNADLARSVEEGRFRRDLYYRLAVVPIRLPPLREREGDVILLARHFLAKYGEQLKGRPRRAGEGRRAAAARRTPGRATSASCRTSSSARCSSSPGARLAREGPRRAPARRRRPRSAASAALVDADPRRAPRRRAAATRRRSRRWRRRSSPPRSPAPRATSSGPPSCSA